MYVPGPRQNTPAEYQTRGVAIGDVGRVTPEGTFDFFFNIYLPSEHPINANTPEGFTPMSQYTPADILHLDYDPGNFVSTSAIQKLDFESQSDEFPGGDFVFICGAPQGAVLALPHGARFEKLENLETLRAYVATHAESWYKYINGPRGRGLANGSLYLVTGWEKARTWGMASFHSTDEDFQLAFKPIPRADATYQYRWSGAPGRRNPAQKKSYEPSPISNGPLNQTTFIHGLSISLGTGIWGKLFGTVEIREIAESQLGLGGSNGNSTSYPPGSSLFSWSLGFFGGGTTAGGKQHAQQVILSDISPISKILHPGELISNYILHKAPQAAVVMSHDDDWRDILGDDPTGSNIQTISQFLQRINDQFNIAEKDGATFLSESESPISVEIRPPTPPVSSATNALERSPTSAHADVVITVEGPPDEPVSAGVTHEMLTMELGMHGSNLTPISPISSTTVPKRESKGLFAGIPGIRHQQLFSPIEFLSNHPYTANRQRAHSLDSKQPIPFLRSRAYSDTTASRPFVLLQSHHLQGSAIDDGSSSDVERSPSSSNPSSPARSSHHTHSPMLPSWVGGPFLAPPNAAMDRRHHARGSETASNRSTTPNLDWDRSSGIGSDPDDMDSSPHSPAWGQTAFLAPPDAAAQGRPRASSWGSPETASNPSSSLIRDSQTNNATVSTGTPFGARDRSASPSPDPPVYDSLYPRSQRPRSWAPQSDKTRVYYPGGFEPPQQKPFPGYWGQLVLKPASAGAGISFPRYVC
ncbi:hypothetical protein B0H19DRAFT_91564 [Mycena capillaripes]|nr:hypothetical protein B0H19DRAFT_91564 [Mycena capillaripes]